MLLRRLCTALLLIGMAMTTLVAPAAAQAPPVSTDVCTITYAANAAAGTRTLANLRVFGTNQSTIFSAASPPPESTANAPDTPAYACGRGASALAFELTKSNGNQFRKNVISAAAGTILTFGDGAQLIIGSGNTVEFRAPANFAGSSYTLQGPVAVTGTDAGEFNYTSGSAFEIDDYRTGASLTIIHGGFLPGQQNSSPPQYIIQVSVVAAATITAITPTRGPVAGGTAITITGSGFSASGNAVTVGGNVATITSQSATSITATTPAGTAGTASVTITTAASEGSQSVTAATPFTYVAAPAVTSVAPTAGPTAGSNSVVVTGVGFGTGTPDVSRVLFGDTPATGFTVNSNTQITAIAPPRAAGPVNVTVTTSGGTSAAGAGNQYTYVAPPAAPVVIVPANGSTISSTTPTYGGTAAANATITVFVDNGSIGTTTANGAGNWALTQPTPLAVGAHTVRATASNVGGTSPSSATNSFTVVPTLTVAPATLPNPTVGTAYSQTITTSGGTAPYTYAVTAGALPTGLSLSPGGTLSGTPTAGGTFNFTITATDSATTNGGPFNGSRAYTVTVQAPTLALTPAQPSTLPGATGGVAYSLTISTSGGTAPYTYTVVAGVLPPGLTLSGDGVLSGTPSATGTYSFRIRSTDSSTGTGAPYSTQGTGSYSLTVAAPTITLAPATLPGGTVAQAYAQTITATGSGTAYTYAVTAGALPAGVTLASSGSLSGTPTAGGTFNFTVTATDPNGFTGARAYSLTIAAPTIAVAPATLPNATTRVAYSQAITASGGTAPYSFAVTAGALPAGITLSAGGTLAGTATTAGSFTFTVTATDSSTGAGPYAGTRSYTLTVAAPTIALAPATLPNATTRVAYSQTITATGGASPYAYAVTAGALPAGITLATDGTLSGTANTAGSFSFTVTATDVNGNTGVQGYTLTVATPTIALAPASVPNATQNVAYSQTITATGGTAPYSYAVTAGALPAGITLATNGALAGSPTMTGSFTFTVTATDANGNTGAQGYMLTVVPPPITITPATLPDGTVETPYSQTITATGTTAPYSFAVTAGSLPSGLTLATDGTLSGTPDAEGSFTFTVTATDSGSTASSAERSYTISIAARAGGLTRTWVSGTGDDDAACSRTAPCQTFAIAFARTATGGEINCLDAGGYGAVTITRSVSIVCGDKVGRGGVLVSGGDGITVAAPADARVVLSGLDFEGIGNSGATPGSSGVRFQSGGSLLVRNSTFRGFRGYAVAFQPTNAAQLYLTNVRVTDSGLASDATTAGILVRPAGSGLTVRATVAGSQVAGGQQSGIVLETAAGSSSQVFAAIVDTVVTGNAGAGVLTRGLGGAIQTHVSGATLTGNGFGLITNGSSSTTTIADGTISRNATGILSIGGGATRSAGGNILAGNTTDGTFSGTTPRQ